MHEDDIRFSVEYHGTTPRRVSFQPSFYSSVDSTYHNSLGRELLYCHRLTGGWMWDRDNCQLTAVTNLPLEDVHEFCKDAQQQVWTLLDNAVVMERTLQAIDLSKMKLGR